MQALNKTQRIVQLCIHISLYYSSIPNWWDLRVLKFLYCCKQSYNHHQYISNSHLNYDELYRRWVFIGFSVCVNLQARVRIYLCSCQDAIECASVRVTCACQCACIRVRIVHVSVRVSVSIHVRVSVHEWIAVRVIVHVTVRVSVNKPVRVWGCVCV